MIKYVFIFTLFFVANSSVFSQKKSTKKPPQKSSTILNTSNSKSTIITKKVIIKPDKSIEKSKIVTNKSAVDTSKIIGDNKEREAATKPVNNPLNGPIGTGPQSYEKKTEVKMEKIKNKKQASKPKNHTISKWISKNLTLGLRSGVNFSNITNFSHLVYSGTNIPTATNAFGYNGGIVIGLQSSRNIKFQAEILISQQGSQILQSLNKFKFRTTYLKVPLLLKKEFGTKKINYFVSGGGYFGYTIAKKSIREIGGKLFNNKIEFEKGYDVFGKKENRFDFGPAIGVGIKYQLPIGSISLETRYEYGISNIILYQSEQLINKYVNSQNRVLSTSITFNFPFRVTNYK